MLLFCCHYSEMDPKLILVVIGAFATAFGRSEAITCYMCYGDTGSACADPLKSDGAGVSLCTNASACIKLSGTYAGRRIIFALLCHSHRSLLILFSMANIGNLKLDNSPL